MITKQQALQMLIANIAVNFMHRDLDRTISHAALMNKLITGEGVETLLRQFTPRETEVMFNQRVAITHSVVKPIAAKAMRPVRKIQRVNPVVKSIAFDGDTDNKKGKELTEVVNTFYGGQPLDVVIGGRGNDLQGLDPNAFMLMLFSKFDNRFSKPEPYIVDIPCSNISDFQFFNDILQYLIIRAACKYIVSTGDQKEEKDGFHYQIYVDNDAYEFIPVDDVKYSTVPKGGNELSHASYKDPVTGVITQEDFYRFADERTFIVRYYNHKAGQVPAWRVGALPDPFTQNRTCVSILDNATPYFLKSIKTVSEMDLGMTLHAHAQKVVYAPRCEGTKADGCYNGRIRDQSRDCSLCKGTGRQSISTTAQDVIEITMPDTKDMDKAFDLSKLVHYVTVPIDLLTFQKEYTDSLEDKIMSSIYNSERFSQNQLQFDKTATANLMDWESIYDTLFPIASKDSQMWMTAVKILAAYRDELKGLKVQHQYPKDFKYKSVRILIDDLKAANESKAPDFVQQEINNDLAQNLYQDRPQEFKRLKGHQRFNPFEGKSIEEIQYLITNKNCTQYSQTLYSESKRIFQSVEDAAKNENPPLFFWDLADDEQQKRIDAEVDVFIAEIEAQQVNSIPFSGQNPGTGGANPSGGTGGQPGLDPQGNPIPQNPPAGGPAGN